MGMRELIEKVLGETVLTSPPDGEASERLISVVLSKLSPNEMRVVVSHYGLNNSPHLSFRVIAEGLNVSTERVRQVELKALRKLRHPCRKKYFLALSQAWYGIKMLLDEDDNMRNGGLNLLLSELELSCKTHAALSAAGIHTLADLIRFSDDELLKLKGFGRKSLSEVRNLLKERGLALI